MSRLLPRLAVVALVLVPFVACDSAKDTVVGAFMRQSAPESAPEGTAEPAPPESVDSSKLIYVVPVEGVNGPGRMVLADAIAAQLRDADKPAVLAEHVNEKGPTVAGNIEKVEQHGSVVWVTAAWALKAPYGTAVAEYRHQIVVDAGLWQRGSAEAINLLAADAGPAVTAMIKDYISPVALAPAPEPPPLGGTPAPAPETTTAAAPPPAPVPPAAQGRAPPPGADVASAPTTGFHPPMPPGRPEPLPAEPAPQTAETAALAPAPAPEPVPEAEHVKPLAATPTAPQPPRPAETRPKALTVPKPQPAAKPKPQETAKAAAKRKAEQVLMPVPEDAAKAKPKPRPKPKPKKTAKQTVRELAEKRAEEKARKKKAEKILMPVPDDEPSRLVPDPPPVSWGRPSFLIKPVRGAPGDGNASLTEAMKEALRKRDLTVTEDPRQAGFVIEGKVELSAPIDGRQHAKIVWAVNTINGEEVGKAVQENAVKAGSLNGPWGRVAVIVSNAAVVGIQELFGIEEKQSSLNAPPADFSNMPDLPRVPGRAPPPPK